jgi:hypothetical protein
MRPSLICAAVALARADSGLKEAEHYHGRR